MSDAQPMHETIQAMIEMDEARIPELQDRLTMLLDLPTPGPTDLDTLMNEVMSAFLQLEGCRQNVEGMKRVLSVGERG